MLLLSTYERFCYSAVLSVVVVGVLKNFCSTTYLIAGAYIFEALGIDSYLIYASIIKNG